MKLSTLTSPSYLPMLTNRELTYRSTFRNNHSQAKDEIHLRPIAVIKASGVNDYSGFDLGYEKGNRVDLYV